MVRLTAQWSAALQSTAGTTRYLLTAVLALLLTACAGQQARLPTDASWTEHSARLQALDSWTAEGKLALRSSEQSESASLLWRQQGGDTYLQLSGPMGLNRTAIRSDGRQLEVSRGDDINTWDISTPNAMVQETGWDLPLQALPHWLKGLPAPDSRISLLELDPDRTLLRILRQDGWEIRYETYANFGNFTLPTRLQILRADTSARVIIRNWKTFPG
jgi:outer membrane lipoprotein LolB